MLALNKICDTNCFRNEGKGKHVWTCMMKGLCCCNLTVAAHFVSKSHSVYCNTVPTGEQNTVIL
jgi:hypothetical protein